VCDCCEESIKPIRNIAFNCDEYNYFVITTSHHDWGNDSCDSVESFDVCSPECAEEMAGKYLRKAFGGHNTMQIEIEHVRSLRDGTDRDYMKKIEGWNSNDL